MRRGAKITRVHHYGEPNYFRDIAIIEVNKPFKLHEKYAFPACLPDHDQVPGKICYISGWGVGEYLF